jgi:hypothetical protein
LEEQRSKFFTELKSPPRKTQTPSKLQQQPTKNPLETFSQWIKIKHRQLEFAELPSDFDQIEKELLKQKQVLNEINGFKERIDEAKAHSFDENIEDYKHDLNEIEISFNLLYVGLNRSFIDDFC